MLSWRPGAANDGALGIPMLTMSVMKGHPPPLGPAPPPGLAFDAGTDPAPLMAKVEELMAFAFQPIVSAHSGQCYGYEALPQGFERLGFSSLAALTGHAFDHGRLGQLETTLREKAVRDFARFAGKGERLFLGLDCRALASAEDAPRRTAEMLARHGLNPTAVCLCLAETQSDGGSGLIESGLEAWRRRSYLLALDRFGAGPAGLKRLYDHQPNLIKIDRAFTAGIQSDERKKLFVSTVVNLAHVLGITVIAGGIAAEEEFRTCKQIGCDLIEGSFVGTPATIATAFTRSYTVISETNRRERRERRSDQRLLREELTLLPALHVGDPMAKVYQAFRAHKEHGFLPIVDDRHQPIGIIREIDLRDVIYSRYGKDLLHNKALHRGLLDFLRPCPVCDINTEAERILEIFSQAVDPPGILLVDDFEYVGVLSAASLLRVINEKNLALARDQNPLTRLPGNSSINDHITAALETADSSWTFAYFDLDNFKPFNDRFGFRQGDRAILLFSELMRTQLGGTRSFLGHIGGDDFFASFRDIPAGEVRGRVEAALTAFRRDVESFYDPESRERGHIVGRGRDGALQQFPLLSCSAALVEIAAGERAVTVDDIGGTIATLKKTAKSAPDHIACQRLG